MMKKQSISEIKQCLEGARTEDLRPLLLSYAEDERQGVQKLLRSFERKLEKVEALHRRHESMLSFDRSYSDYVIGIDEVGRGPLFGPVLSAACHIRPCEALIEVFDSKSLSEEKREALFDKILECADAFGIGIVGAKEIDRIGIQSAIAGAMKQALDACFEMLESTRANGAPAAAAGMPSVLADYISFSIEGYAPTPIVKGDTKSFQIACASILAKVTRDRLVAQMAERYPDYDLKNNKGYGSQRHLEAIRRLGPCEEHRMSFLRGILNETAR